MLNVWWNYASATKICRCWYWGILLLMAGMFMMNKSRQWGNAAPNKHLKTHGNTKTQTQTQAQKQTHTYTHTHTKNIKKHSFRHDFFSKFLISRVGEVTLHFKRITLPSQQGQTKILVNYICCSNFAKIIFCRRYVFILSFCIPFTLMFSGWYFKHAGFPLHQPWVCFDPMDSKF